MDSSRATTVPKTGVPDGAPNEQGGDTHGGPPKKKRKKSQFNARYWACGVIMRAVVLAFRTKIDNSTRQQLTDHGLWQRSSAPGHFWRIHPDDSGDDGPGGDSGDSASAAQRALAIAGIQKDISKHRVAQRMTSLDYLKKASRLALYPQPFDREADSDDVDLFEEMHRDYDRSASSGKKSYRAFASAWTKRVIEEKLKRIAGEEGALRLTLKTPPFLTDFFDKTYKTPVAAEELTEADTARFRKARENRVATAPIARPPVPPIRLADAPQGSGSGVAHVAQAGPLVVPSFLTMTAVMPNLAARNSHPFANTIAAAAAAAAAAPPRPPEQRASGHQQCSHCGWARSKSLHGGGNMGRAALTRFARAADRCPSTAVARQALTAPSVRP